MKKKGIETLKIILTIILFINILLINNTKSYADNHFQQEILDGGSGGSSGGSTQESEQVESSTGMSDISENPGSWAPSAPIDSTDLDNKVEIIISLVRTIGIIVSVASLSLIGIKFLVGSAEEKAQYKQTMMPWLAGAIMVFAITFLPTIIYNVINDSDGAGHTQSGGTNNQNVQISIDKPNITLKIGEITETTLQAISSDGTVRSARWTSNNVKVATVDQKGKVQAKAKGTAVIKAFYGNSVATCNVTVDVVETTGISISNESITLNDVTTKTHQLTATVTPSNSGEPVNWSSSNNAVATVKNGQVKAVGIGTATITATSGTKSASCQVTVENVRTTNIEISQEELILNAPIEKTHKLIATITPSYSKEPITWKSSDTNVVTVENGELVAKGAGKAIITVQSGNATATCNVEVKSSRVFEGYYYNKQTNQISTKIIENTDLPFTLYVPPIEEVSGLDKLPLIIYLHGGEHNTAFSGVWGVKGDNPFGLQKNNVNYPAICIFPVTPYKEGAEDNGWHRTDEVVIERLRSLINFLVSEYNVDSNRIALTGFSNGASGTWRLSSKYPTLFSCIVPICAYYNKDTYPDCPSWIIASKIDGSWYTAEKMAEKLRMAGKQVKLDLYNLEHSETEKAAYTKKLINWMAERNRRTNSTYKFN